MAELKEILANMVRYIVDDPEKVEVHQTEDENNVALVLNVSPDDMGKVIGRHGRIAHAIRMIMKSAANSAGKKVSVEIAQNDA